MKKNAITVSAKINAPVNKVWKMWTTPSDICKWNNASDDWHTTDATNNLTEGGRFTSRMESKDGRHGFDFSGIYNNVVPNEKIEYTMDDGRKTSVSFESKGDATVVTEMFDPESENSEDMQRNGWQAILDNFKKYVESKPETTMEKLVFHIDINAPVDKVYTKTIEDASFSEWTKLFNETSKFEGSWKKGSKILFLGTDKEGKQGGMVSHIKDNIPDKYISIEHRGVLYDGKEIMDGPEVDPWAGGNENYIYEDIGGKTRMTVELDSNHDFKKFFEETFPKALDVLKDICER